MKEKGFIKLRRWLLPASWLYGMVVALRNCLFDWGVLKSHRFDVPVICVGNLTVGGTGKTPHTEYLLRLLSPLMRVAVVSRGYKRKTKGYLLADNTSTPSDLGDEPYQMKHKFPDAHVAVDANRCEAITRLMDDEATRDTGVVLLDDAFQHRYVKAGLSILLIDYNRLVNHDALLPAGRLREPVSGKKRAQVIIVTKCPRRLMPLDFRVLTKAVSPYPFQSLFFTTLKYGRLRHLSDNEERPLDSIKDHNVLLLTGIASPRQIEQDLTPYGAKTITPLTFADHHAYTPRDIERIAQTFDELPEPKLIITTEKDAVRINALKNSSENSSPSQLHTSHFTLHPSLYVLPITVEFLQDQEKTFNEKILTYVRQNSTNSTVAQSQNDNVATANGSTKPQDSHHPRVGPRTISFRSL